jgi:two-component system chemotaxis response regulator CheB
VTRTTTIELVVIGASAGGLEALLALLKAVPQKSPVALVVVIHTPSDSSSYLPQILTRRTRSPVAFAEDGASIQAGRVYIAPPDFHVLVKDHNLRLSRGPKENGFRPAVDPLFRSASRARGAGVMGIVLSGGLNDGTHGLKTIKEGGGITVVQDPDEATVAGMPQSAIRQVTPDYVLAASAIGALIADLGGTTTTGGTVVPKQRDPESQNPAEVTEVEDMQEQYGAPSGLTCPDCGGALWEINQGDLTRYRCHVGHQYSPEGLDVEQHEAVEGALWSAVRVLEEHADLRRRMALRATHAGLSTLSRSFEDSAKETQQQAAQIRTLLFARTTPEPKRSPAASPASARPKAVQRAQAAKKKPRRRRTA